MRTKYLTLLFSILFLSPLVGWADPGPLSAFFSALSGRWNGTGTVVSYVGQKGEFSISVSQAFAETAAGEWSSDSVTKGMPGNSAPVNTSYTLAGERLLLTTPAYTAEVSLETARANELAYTVDHADPQNGQTTRLTRDMKIGADGSLHILADVYGGGRLAEHYDFTLQRAKN